MFFMYLGAKIIVFDLALSQFNLVMLLIIIIVALSVFTSQERYLHC